MPTYVYRNAKGEEREIVMRITAAKPRAVTFNPDGSWTEVPEGDPLAFKSVISGGQTVNAGPVRNKYPVISRTLPKNLPGCPTDRYGATVIKSRRHEQQIMGRFGYTRSE